MIRPFLRFSSQYEQNGLLKKQENITQKSATRNFTNTKITIIMLPTSSHVDRKNLEKKKDKGIRRKEGYETPNPRRRGEEDETLVVHP